MQPSDWMSDVLRGQPALTIQQQLSVLAEATLADMPGQLRRMPGEQSHHLLAPAIVSGKPQQFVLSISVPKGGGSPQLMPARLVQPNCDKPVPFLATGSGMRKAQKGDKWLREILRRVRAFEHGKLDPLSIADSLAALNAEVALSDPFVAKRCIVAWRCNGGSTQFYDGDQRVNSDIDLPIVANGIDLRDLVGAMRPIWTKKFEEGSWDDSALDRDAIEAALDTVSQRPGRQL